MFSKQSTASSTAVVFTTILFTPALFTTRILVPWRRGGRYRSCLRAVGRGLWYGSCLRPVVGCDLWHGSCLRVAGRGLWYESCPQPVGRNMRRTNWCVRALLVLLLISFLILFLIAPWGDGHLLRHTRRLRCPFGRLRAGSSLVPVTSAKRLGIVQPILRRLRSLPADSRSMLQPSLGLLWSRRSHLFQYLRLGARAFGYSRQQAGHLLIRGPGCLGQRALDVPFHPSDGLVRHLSPGHYQRLHLFRPSLNELQRQIYLIRRRGGERQANVLRGQFDRVQQVARQTIASSPDDSASEGSRAHDDDQQNGDEPRRQDEFYLPTCCACGCSSGC